jgi:polyisoprenoid-binding protein YceI
MDEFRGAWLAETRNCKEERMGMKVLKTLAFVAWRTVTGMFLIAPVMAQDTVWRIDSEHSTARLFLASSKNPDAGGNVGVARTSGLIDHEAGDPSRSDFDFTIYPADKTADESGKNPEYTVIRFKSTHVVPVNEETFRVTGDLTLSYVERSVTADPSEAYSGPLYGPAVHHSVTQESVFEFHEVSPGGTQKATDNKAEWLAWSSTIGEDFPQLFKVVSTTNWPTFVADERCVVPSVGEDFSGPSCTGETVERIARADVRCEVPSIGEDYAGEICTATSPVQVANEVQMQLDLHLTKTAPAMAAISGQ